jgi:hypothetical protein
MSCHTARALLRGNSGVFGGLASVLPHVWGRRNRRSKRRPYQTTHNGAASSALRDPLTIGVAKAQYKNRPHRRIEQRPYSYLRWFRFRF